MSFGKAAKDKVVLDGTASGRMPDYVKHPALLPSRAANAAQLAGKPKAPLPRVPLKKEKSHSRVSTISNGKWGRNGDGHGWDGDGMAVARCLQGSKAEAYGPGMAHPLEHFARQVPLREVNGVRLMADEPKVTEGPYDHEGCLRQRAAARQMRMAIKEANSGGGYGIFGNREDRPARGEPARGGDENQS